MRYGAFAFILILTAFLVEGYAQAAPEQTECPKTLVCISREAAQKALQDQDELKAVKAELAVKDKAIDDYKSEIQKMREEFIRADSEATALKQNEVRTNAIIDLLLKSTRKKCLPFSICIGG